MLNLLNCLNFNFRILSHIHERPNLYTVPLFKPLISAIKTVFFAGNSNKTFNQALKIGSCVCMRVCDVFVCEF